MQSFVNKPGSAITSSLEGLALCYPDLLRVHYRPDFVRRADPSASGKVAIISGSGSGHEPLPVGYVGVGMLDAACPGPIFTSPTPDQLLAATRAVPNEAGVVYVVKNYAGGVFNSEIAMEMASLEGITVESVLINDDVSISEVSNRRGLGAAPLTFKIAGAAAEAGMSLEEVLGVASRTVSQTRSMGVAMNTYTLHRSLQVEKFAEDTLEIGVGIHGEPGQRLKVTGGIEEIVERLMHPILADLPFHSGDKVLLMVSGLGGTPWLELYLFFQKIHRLLGQEGIEVRRRLVGNYLTSLGRGGCIVTLLRLDSELTKLWDAPVQTPTLHW